MEKQTTYKFKVDETALGYGDKDNDTIWNPVRNQEEIDECAKDLKVSPELIGMIDYFKETLIEGIKDDLISLYERIDQLDKKLKER
jgi:hypothetical protein